MTAKQSLVLFIIIWLHISLLDFVFIGYRGLVFLWQQSTEWQTLLTHLVISSLALTCFWLTERYFGGRKS